MPVLEANPINRKCNERSKPPESSSCRIVKQDRYNQKNRMHKIECNSSDDEKRIYLPLAFPAADPICCNERPDEHREITSGKAVAQPLGVFERNEHRNN